jgi:hypothetical protein
MLTINLYWRVEVSSELLDKIEHCVAVATEHTDDRDETAADVRAWAAGARAELARQIAPELEEAMTPEAAETAM